MKKLLKTSIAAMAAALLLWTRYVIAYLGNENTFSRVMYYADQPAAICMDTAKVLNENYYYVGEGEPSLYAAFGGGSKHPELAAEFLKFIQ